MPNFLCSQISYMLFVSFIDSIFSRTLLPDCSHTLPEFVLDFNRLFNTIAIVYLQPRFDLFSLFLFKKIYHLFITYHNGYVISRHFGRGVSVLVSHLHKKMQTRVQIRAGAWPGRLEKWLGHCPIHLLTS